MITGDDIRRLRNDGDDDAAEAKDPSFEGSSDVLGIWAILTIPLKAFLRAGQKSA